MSLTTFAAHVATELPKLGVDAEVSFGRRARAKQMNQGPGRANRVVIVPGDDAGSLGKYVAAKKVEHPGQGLSGRRSPRALWDWVLNISVYVWAYDPSAPEDELAQWTAVVELHDYVHTVVHEYAPGLYEVGSPKRVGEVVERRFGEELVFVVGLQQPVLVGPKPRTDDVVAGIGSVVLGESEEPGC